MERTYAPYAKWLGTAFSRLGMAPDLTPHLSAALAAPTYPGREAALAEAYQVVARRHSALGLTAPLDTRTRLFHERPFQVLAADRFARACIETIQDPWLKALPHAGGVDQWVDSTEVLSSGALTTRLMSWYDDPGRGQTRA